MIDGSLLRPSPFPTGNWQHDFESRYGLPALDGSNFALRPGKLRRGRFPPSHRDADDLDREEIAAFRTSHARAMNGDDYARDANARSSNPTPPHPTPPMPPVTTTPPKANDVHLPHFPPAATPGPTPTSQLPLLTPPAAQLDRLRHRRLYHQKLPGPPIHRCMKPSDQLSPIA